MQLARNAFTIAWLAEEERAGTSTRSTSTPRAPSSVRLQSEPMAGPTQEALYSEIDLELSWSEAELPQVERTKHVHGLHPYLGKYVPQLVEVFLRRYFRAGPARLRPVRRVGHHARRGERRSAPTRSAATSRRSTACSAASRRRRYSLGELELGLRAALEEARRAGPADRDGASDVAPERGMRRGRSASCSRYREVAAERLDDPALGRRARSSSPARPDRLGGRRISTSTSREAPATAPYYCHKHKRTCRPVEEAAKFLSRYTTDTVRRIRAFAEVRTERRRRGDPRRRAHACGCRVPPDGVITSPPYPGLIDYHEQHRYSYELLRLATAATKRSARPPRARASRRGARTSRT